MNAAPATTHHRMPDAEALAVDLLVTSSAFARSMARISWDGPRQLWRAMVMLDQLGACRVTELAEHDRISQPTASNIVTRLESEGWAHRIPDPSDGRAQLVELSPAGTTQLATLRRGAAAKISDRLEGLDDADLDAIERTLALMKRLMRP